MASKRLKADALQSASTLSVYTEAVNRLIAELNQVREQKKALAFREAQINDSLRALFPLTGAYEMDINTYSLSNAVRFIFNGLEPDRTLTAIQVRTKLDDLGYDLTKYDNPLASIHTCVRRMIDTEELKLVEGNEEEKKKFEAGPELKPVPEPSDNISLLSQILAGEKKEAKEEGNERLLGAAGNLGDLK